MIDSDTPLTTDPALESVMPPRRVHSVTVPLTDEPLSFDVQLNGPGQLLVAIDGVVLTNDGEELDRLEQTVPGRWDIAHPSLREGYLHSFGQEQRRTAGGLTPAVLAEEGIDVSDGEITVSVDARGFPNDDWRVVVSSDNAGEGLGTTEPLQPMAETDFAEYAFGHRLLSAYEVPTDGIAHPVPIDAVVARPWRGCRSARTRSRILPAAYSPISGPGASRAPSAPSPASRSRLRGCGDPRYRHTHRITLADLDADNTTAIEVPETQWTELYVTTEGVGRFWLESADPDEGSITSGDSPANYGSTMGREDWWTSGTDQKVTWPDPGADRLRP